jgi:hypothetical protein
MNGLQPILDVLRGPWGAAALAAIVILLLLLDSVVPRLRTGGARRTEQESRALKNVPSSVVARARELIRAGTPLLAVKLLNEEAGISQVDAHTYVKVFQAAEQGNLSFSEAITVQLACDVKAHLDHAEREPAVKLLVTRAGAPQAEAVRLIELVGSTRSHRAWLSGKPLPEAGSKADLQKVDALAAEGKKLEAIKLYRQLTGATLKEAQEYVDSR